MRAVQYVTANDGPQLVDIPIPEPGPGQVLLRMTAAGLCHSDLAVMSMPAAQLPFALPMTLGHEGVGTVAALGAGVTGVGVGDAVAVYGAWGCGRCHPCAQGKENLCIPGQASRIPGPGLGRHGTLAEYLLVDDVRHLAPLGALDPILAVPLTDAALTPYHAIRATLPKLTPGSTAVVIGAGGLGHMAIQILRALTPAQVVALDVSDDKLALATSAGAHHALCSDDHAAAAIRHLTDGRGAQAVFDCVAAPATVATATRCIAAEGDVVLIGLGAGTARVGVGAVPFGASFRTSYWGSRTDLIEVLDLARRGALNPHVERFTLEEVPDAYKRLHARHIAGRAVVVLEA